MRLLACAALLALGGCAAGDPTPIGRTVEIANAGLEPVGLYVTGGEPISIDTIPATVSLFGGPGSEVLSGGVGGPSLGGGTAGPSISGGPALGPQAVSGSGAFVDAFRAYFGAICRAVNRCDPAAGLLCDALEFDFSGIATLQPPSWAISFLQCLTRSVNSLSCAQLQGGDFLFTGCPAPMGFGEDEPQQ
jgi:hypothetical protein